jgi:hypothetical protein
MSIQSGAQASQHEVHRGEPVWVDHGPDFVRVADECKPPARIMFAPADASFAASMSVFCKP